jgi:RND family efflux transporter MFP subunit
MLAHKPAMPTQTATSEPPLVSIITATPQTLRLDVQSQGIVKPRTEMDLVPEVAGKITYVHPHWEAGGFFAKDDLLVAIEARDYDYAIAEARARIAEAKRVLLSEQAQAQQARTEWQTLGVGQATPLALREPQLAEARAKLQAAEADLSKAQLKRSRCELRAPFAGRIREKISGLAQFVQAGEKLAHLYATDVAEIRLPINSKQLAFVDVPLGEPNTDAKLQTIVNLTADIAGRVVTWQGRIVRTEGVVDASNGQIYVVAQVAQPYRQAKGQAPLLAGLFVQASIHGKTRQDVFVLPPTAVDAEQQVWLVDNAQKLTRRKISVLRFEPERLVVSDGLQAGDKVVVSGLPIPIEGMKVKIENPPTIP